MSRRSTDVQMPNALLLSAAADTWELLNNVLAWKQRAITEVRDALTIHTNTDQLAELTIRSLSLSHDEIPFVTPREPARSSSPFNQYTIFRQSDTSCSRITLFKSTWMSCLHYVCSIWIQCLTLNSCSVSVEVNVRCRMIEFRTRLLSISLSGRPVWNTWTVSIASAKIRRTLDMG